MKIFVSALTIYRYDNDRRRLLNIEEANKFYQGLKFASAPERIYIFSDYTEDDFRNLDKFGLEEEEVSAFTLLVVENLKIMRKGGVDVRFVGAELVDYGHVLEMADQIMRNTIERQRSTGDDGEEDRVDEVYLNLSCGHKIGSLALYVKLLNLAHEYKNLVLHPYHAEADNVEELPVVDITSNIIDVEHEEFLEVFDMPKSYAEAKKQMVSQGIPERDAEDIIVYLARRGLIEKEMRDTYSLTVRGRTLLALNRSLHGRS